MCGRYALRSSVPEMARLLGVALEDVPDDVLDFTPSYNIAPGRPLPVCRVSPNGSRTLERLRWGLIPHWSKDGSGRLRTINARAETVATRPAYRRPVRRQRCLVPADGFYEWRQRGGARQPFLIRMATGSPFAFAGLWDRWCDTHGEAIDSYTIVTTTANAALGRIHPRMPVIVHPDDHALWLDTRVTRPEQIERVMRPYEAETLCAVPVSTFVNKPRNDDVRCWTPLSENHGTVS